MERKLASIRTIAEIKPIEGADLICAYRVDGWWVVGKKGQFQVNDLVAYFEIDSWIPYELAPFLSKGKEPREFNGVKGERLRTVRLKGQISQGLLLHLRDDLYGHLLWMNNHWDGQDLTEHLNIQKWEPPIHPTMRGQIRGNFPSWARKTDQERCQNLKQEIQFHYDNDTLFEVTVKLDGSSMSVGMSPEQEFVVCSRNLSLKLDDIDNTFIKTAMKHELEEKLKSVGNSLMIQGELIGPGIQGNPENLKDYEYHVFDIFDPNEFKYISPKERLSLVKEFDLKHVPVLHKSITLKELGLATIDDILAFAEGPSYKSNQREGVVFKSIDGSFSFKAISNSYLLKQK